MTNTVRLAVIVIASGLALTLASAATPEKKRAAAASEEIEKIVPGATHTEPLYLDYLATPF
jgi:hypothetical protein